MSVSSAGRVYCHSVSIIREKQDKLCTNQITCNCHPHPQPITSDFSRAEAQKHWTSVELRLNNYLSSYIWAKMYKHTCLQIKHLCTKSSCHTHNPNGCFELSVIYSQNIHLAAPTKSSIFDYLAAQQSSNSCVLSILLIIFLTALRLHSGESSQNSKRSPVQA